MPTKPELLEHALAILRRGSALTLDALAHEAGITKPGVVHHFSTKEGLMESVVDVVCDRWEAQLIPLLDGIDGAHARLRAYVEHSFTHEFDSSDLAPLADINLRSTLLDRWSNRLSPWLELDDEEDPPGRANRMAAWLMADGAWLNQALGTHAMTDDERTSVRDVALRLIDEAPPA